MWVLTNTWGLLHLIQRCVKIHTSGLLCAHLHHRELHPNINSWCNHINCVTIKHLLEIYQNNQKSVAISNNRRLSSLPRLLLLTSGRWAPAAAWAAVCPGWDALLLPQCRRTPPQSDGSARGSRARSEWWDFRSGRVGSRVHSSNRDQVQITVYWPVFLFPQWKAANLGCQQLKSCIVIIVILIWLSYSFLVLGNSCSFWAHPLRARAHQTVYIPAPFLVGTIKNCLWEGSQEVSLQAVSSLFIVVDWD